MEQNPDHGQTPISKELGQLERVGHGLTWLTDAYPGRITMSTVNAPLNRKLRMGLIGGGGQGFIGRVHATAATLDNRAELVAGALSSDPVRSRTCGADFGLAPDRAYGTYQELLQGESRLPEEQRIDFVSIATPNHTHFAIARGALQAGFHVVCDKPMTIDLPQAQALARLVEQTGAVFVVTHSYTGYPLVRQAREMVHEGYLGEVLAIRVNYIQGGLWGINSGEPPTRGAWKADPAQAGPAGAWGDIGTHAFNLMRYVTHTRPVAVSAHLRSFHSARPLDDYGHAVLRTAGGTMGTVTVSQVTHGRLNDLSIEVDGTTRSMQWRQERPGELIVRQHGEALQVFERNPKAAYLRAPAREASRLPGGHPEGVLEAFANLYCDGFDAMVARAAGAPIENKDTVYPNVYDGLEGVHFVEQCLASHCDEGSWKPMDSALAR
jgi:predicted dehydrogenase